MKSIRIIPVALLLVLFILNLYLGYITYPHQSYVKYIIFSVVYLATGFMMITKIRFAEFAGFLIPLAIFFIYPMILDFKNLHPWSSGVLSVLNAIVMISCFILVMLKIKS
jgi:hypothetical protein